jgi:hypothetical protein
VFGMFGIIMFSLRKEQQLNAHDTILCQMTRQSLKHRNGFPDSPKHLYMHTNDKSHSKNGNHIFFFFRTSIQIIVGGHILSTKKLELQSNKSRWNVSHARD